MVLLRRPGRIASLGSVARHSGFGRDVFPTRTGSRCSVLASLVTEVAGAERLCLCHQREPEKGTPERGRVGRGKRQLA